MASQDVTSFIKKFYLAVLGRGYDAGEVAWWIQDATDNGYSIEQVANNMYNGAKNEDAVIKTMSDVDFIKQVYRNILNREAAESDYGYWLQDLQNGASRAATVMNIVNGVQNEDVARINNMEAVADYWAASTDPVPSKYEFPSQVGATEESVAACKEWIDGQYPAGATPSTYHPLDDGKKVYTETGSELDDVYFVKKFAAGSTINGGEGSDTLDFSKYAAGVNVNLSTGTGPNGMKVSWVENVRGTDQDDVLTGNSDANILISGGIVKGDVVDGGVGDDRILFQTIEDVAKSTINGGQNNDTLEITNQTAIQVKAASFDKVSDVETLKVGFKKEVPGASTTITLDAGATFGKSITKVVGAAGTDVIESKGDINVAGITLESIEVLRALGAASTITIGAKTLTSVNTVEGFKTGDTVLELSAKDGDVFDLTKPTFTNIDSVEQIAAAKSTLVVNQSLINSFAANLKTDAKPDGFWNGNFEQSTLKAAGIGLDLSVLRDGDTNFKVIDFNDAHEVTLGNIRFDIDKKAGTDELGALEEIIGSENTADLLRVKPNGGKAEAQDLTDITITSVERMDFEEIGTVALDNDNLLDAEARAALDDAHMAQISGDDDGRYVNANNSAIDNGGTFIDAGRETAEGGLDLSDYKLESIIGFNNKVAKEAENTVTINSRTDFGTAFKEIGADKGVNYTVIMAAAADTHVRDFSAIDNGDDGAAAITFNKAGVADITYSDLVVGSDGDDEITGFMNHAGYELGDGDDTFHGGDDTTESVLGGAGNDTIELGDNDNTDTVTNVNLLVKSLFTGLDAGAKANYLKISNGYKSADAYADGGDGDDVITSGTGDDVLDGGAGGDSLEGGADNDVLIGRAGLDNLSGGKGNDFLAGGSNDDDSNYEVLEGGAGDDVLFGGKGKDTLRGDSAAADKGKDVFLFEAGDSGTTEATVDIINDFVTGEDVISLNWFQNGAVPGALVGDDHTTGNKMYVEDVFNNVSHETSLLKAADAALDHAYGNAPASVGTSIAVQFEYGGKEYVVIDAYKDGEVGYTAENDLIVQISDKVVTDWSITSDDIIVTRWDEAVA